MKIKYLIITLLMVFIITSCYQAGENSSSLNNNSENRNGGESSGINIEVRGLRSLGDPNDADRVRIYFFAAGDITEGSTFEKKNYTFYEEDVNPPYYYIPVTKEAIYYSNSVFNSVISLPINGTAILSNGMRGFESANYNEHILPKSITFNEIPANTQLRILMEYYSAIDYSLDGVLNNSGNGEHLTHAAISAPFSVAENDSKTVTLEFSPAAFGTVNFDLTTSSIDYTSDNSVSVVFMSEEVFNYIFKIEANVILFNDYVTPTSELNDGSVNLIYYKKYTLSTPRIDELMNNPKLDMLPGKKLKLMVIRRDISNNTTVGLADIKKLNPGEQFTPLLDWSYSANFS